MSPTHPGQHEVICALHTYLNLGCPKCEHTVDMLRLCPVRPCLKGDTCIAYLSCFIGRKNILHCDIWMRCPNAFDIITPLCTIKVVHGLYTSFCIPLLIIYGPCRKCTPHYNELSLFNIVTYLPELLKSCSDDPVWVIGILDSAHGRRFPAHIALRRMELRVRSSGTWYTYPMRAGGGRCHGSNHCNPGNGTHRFALQ